MKKNRRNHYRVTRLELERFTIRPYERDSRGSVYDAKHLVCVFFFFQAEDGIRDDLVTGVQTCALPISRSLTTRAHLDRRHPARSESRGNGIQHDPRLAKPEPFVPGSRVLQYWPFHIDRLSRSRAYAGRTRFRQS